MPIYEYACEKCGKQIDVMQKVDAPAPEVCEACGEKGTLARQVSRTSFVLKGGGWYSDLYGSSKKDAGTASPAKTESSSTAPATAAPASTDNKGSGSSGGSSGGTPTPAAGSGGASGGSGGTGSGGSSARPAASPA